MYLSLHCHFIFFFPRFWCTSEVNSLSSTVHVLLFGVWWEGVWWGGCGEEGCGGEGVVGRGVVGRGVWWGGGVAGNAASL